MSCSEQERCPLTNGASLILTDCRKNSKKSAEFNFSQWPEESVHFTFCIIITFTLRKRPGSSEFRLSFISLPFSHALSLDISSAMPPYSSKSTILPWTRQKRKNTIILDNNTSACILYTENVVAFSSILEQKDKATVLIRHFCQALVQVQVPKKRKKEGFGPRADTKITWATTL